jgi:metallo-beta-lactamase family protein
VTNGKSNIFLKIIKKQLHPIEYNSWQQVATSTRDSLSIRLQPAGHIIGSAYLECRFKKNHGQQESIIFSGDLDAPYAPLLAAPKPPYGADLVVLESTNGERLLEDRKLGKEKLKSAIQLALQDRGVLLIPAFSIGRTQELLYEIEDLIHRNQRPTHRHPLQRLPGRWHPGTRHPAIRPTGRLCYS